MMNSCNWSSPTLKKIEDTVTLFLCVWCGTAVVLVLWLSITAKRMKFVYCVIWLYHIAFYCRLECNRECCYPYQTSSCSLVVNTVCIVAANSDWPKLFPGTRCAEQLCAGQHNHLCWVSRRQWCAFDPPALGSWGTAAAPQWLSWGLDAWWFQPFCRPCWCLQGCCAIWHLGSRWQSAVEPQLLC